MKYSTKFPQDTKPLKSCFGNREKMLLKSHLGIKCHSLYNISSGTFRSVPPIVKEGDSGYIMLDLETIKVLIALNIILLTQKVTPFTNLSDVTVHECYNSL